MAKATRLTEAGIARMTAAPPGERIDRTDLLAPGLYLRISEKGRKSWMVHFRVNGRQGKLALGTWPTMKVDEARQLARWARDHARSGKHPRDARKEEELERKRSSGESFETIARQYVEAAKQGKLLGARKWPITVETALERESRLNRLILPSLGHRPIYELSTIEISELLAKIESSGGPVDRCLQDIRLVYKFAGARGYFHGLPPTFGLSNRQSKAKRSRALDDRELKALWFAAKEYGYPFGHATQLLILTGQRRDEIGDVKWSDLDLEKRLLTIPSSRSKNRKGDHEVPLSTAAVEVIDQVSSICEAFRIDSEYIFTTNGRSAISGWSKAGPRLDRYCRAYLADLSDHERSLIASKGKLPPEIRHQKNLIREKLTSVQLPHWRFHDLRHTVVTRMRDGDENEVGETVFAVPLDVIQQIVNHELTVGVTGLYDHGDIEKRYRLRKREALEWWGQKLNSILAQGHREFSMTSFSLSALPPKADIQAEYTE